MVAVTALTLLVGTYTPQWGHTWVTESGGMVYALRSLPEGSLLCVGPAPQGDAPLRDAVPAASRGAAGDALQGAAHVITQDALQYICECPTPGKHSCHITVLERQAVVCDYTSGSLSLFPLDSRGIPCGEVQTIVFEGHGPDRVRQSGAHIHSSWLSPDGLRIVVADLGADRIIRFDVKDGCVDVDSRKDFATPAGCGPRHCCFSPDGRFLYVATELSDELLTYSWPSMQLLRRGTVNDALPHGGGHVAMSPDGRFLYVSSRLKDDGLGIFRIAPDGLPEKVGYVRTGSHPRHFSISADGTTVAVACRDAGTESDGGAAGGAVEIFSRNPEDGMLEKRQSLDTGKPVFVSFR